MKIFVFSVLALYSILGGAYLGLFVTNKKVAKRESVCQVLTFCSVFILMYYIKHLNDMLVPIDKLLQKTFAGDALMCYTMFTFEFMIMTFFLFRMYCLLISNTRKLKRGYANAKKK